MHHYYNSTNALNLVYSAKLFSKVIFSGVKMGSHNSFVVPYYYALNDHLLYTYTLAVVITVQGNKHLPVTVRSFENKLMIFILFTAFKCNVGSSRQMIYVI